MSLPTIVFIHGAGGGGWEWEFWQSIFEERGWSTFAEDLQPCPQGISYTEVIHYVRQINSWLKQAGANEPPIIVAASMAGPLVLQAITDVAVTAVVLVNALPVQGVLGWPQTKVSFSEVIPWAGKGLAERSLKKMPDYDAAVATLIADSWRDESGRVLNRLYAGLPVELPNCPCLVLVGAEDSEISPDLGAAMAVYLKADFMMFHGVSHLGALFGSRAEIIANVVAEWAESIVLSQDDGSIV